MFSHIAKYVLSKAENRELINKLTGENISIDGFINRVLKRSGDLSEIGSVKTPEFEPIIEQFSELIKDDRVVFSFAHPNEKMTLDDFRERIAYYIGLGINAVEINSVAPKEWVKIIIEYQRIFGYIITFGSDCHFRGDDPKKLGDINPNIDEELVMQNLLAFKEKILF